MQNLPKFETVPFAAGRIDELLAKIFSVSALVLSIDVIRNGFEQLSYLNPIWLFAYSGVLLVSLVGAFASAFWFGHMKFWYRAIFFVTLAAMITWPLQVADAAALPLQTTPRLTYRLLAMPSLASTSQTLRATRCRTGMAAALSAGARVAAAGRSGGAAEAAASVVAILLARRQRVGAAGLLFCLLLSQHRRNLALGLA
jgi:hypothetical protein